MLAKVERSVRAGAAFDRNARELPVRRQRSVAAYVRDARPGILATAPAIYSLLLPLAVLHAWVWIFERLCFPTYDLARVPHRRYFALDRHTLPYLNGLEKANCWFCAYANGVVAYVREVVARTEEYWCPIKHQRPLPEPHSRYDRFSDYGDAEGFRRGPGP